jgi:hypothetical protein
MVVAAGDTGSAIDDEMHPAMIIVSNKSPETVPNRIEAVRNSLFSFMV